MNTLTGIAGISYRVHRGWKAAHTGNMNRYRHLSLWERLSASNRIGAGKPLTQGKWGGRGLEAAHTGIGNRYRGVSLWESLSGSNRITAWKPLTQGKWGGRGWKACTEGYFAWAGETSEGAPGWRIFVDMLPMFVVLKHTIIPPVIFYQKS
jgi:hypothetical protein